MASNRSSLNSGEEAPLIESGTKPKTGNQSSMQTIFALWTTMMGSSMLTMPWAFSQSGWALGLVLCLLLGGACYFTAYLILIRTAGYNDFMDVCRKYLGAPGYWCAILSSALILIGALMVLDILMAESLFTLGKFVEIATGAKEPAAWSTTTTAIIVLVLMFPLLLLKDVSTIVKINSFGVVSLFVCIIFIFFASFNTGLRSFSELIVVDSQGTALAGVLFMSYFVHNLFIPIMRNQRNPENNTRDLGIAFVLVGVSYAAIGFIGYMGAHTDDIPQNCFDLYNAASRPIPLNSALAFVARIFLFLQIAVVFPIVVYVVRSQLFLGNAYPSFPKVLGMNSLIMAACTVMAIFFYNQVGTVLRFVGPICGLLYQFYLPLTVDLAIRRENKTINFGVYLTHISILVFGTAIFILQFVAVPTIYAMS